MREIIASAQFEEAVKKMGGHRVIDAAMEPIIDGLRNHPYGFTLVENDFVSFRYARTQRFGTEPGLIVIFQIDEQKNVILEHVEEDNYAD